MFSFGQILNKPNEKEKLLVSIKILSQKNFGPEKILVRKQIKVTLKNFRPKKNVRKNIFGKKIWPKENFSQKEIWVNTNFETEKILCPKETMGIKKMWGPKRFFRLKEFGIGKYFGPKKHFGSKKHLGSKTNLCQKTFCVKLKIPKRIYPKLCGKTRPYFLTFDKYEFISQ